MDITKHDREYRVRKATGTGGWHCRVEGSRIVGWGSRPELAIRDWQAQFRRVQSIVGDIREMCVVVPSGRC